MPPPPPPPRPPPPPPPWSIHPRGPRRRRHSSRRLANHRERRRQGRLQRRNHRAVRIHRSFELLQLRLVGGRVDGDGGVHPVQACPSSSVYPQCLDKNRRDRGNSQSKWTAYKMETPSSRGDADSVVCEACTRQAGDRAPKSVAAAADRASSRCEWTPLPSRRVLLTDQASQIARRRHLCGDRVDGDAHDGAVHLVGDLLAGAKAGAEEIQGVGSLSRAVRCTPLKFRGRFVRIDVKSQSPRHRVGGAPARTPCCCRRASWWARR
eukprot:COSAG01_NODE_5547_length_4191_cov_215.777370_3_plen_265_part_00